MDKILVSLVVTLACTWGCATTPEPVVEPGWEAGAQTASNAPAAGEALTAQQAREAALEVVGTTTLWAAFGVQRSAHNADDTQSPKLLGTVDLTGDGRRELIVSRTDCGAHTCFENVWVYARDQDEGFAQIWHIGPDAEQPGPAGPPQSVELVRDGPDSAWRIAAEGGLINSAGAGAFQRSFRTEWAYDTDAQRFQVLTTRWEESSLRLHRLHDAIVALGDGQVDRAHSLLQEVIDDDSLDELPDDMDDAELAAAMREQLAYAARFVLARIALERGSELGFQSQLGELERSAPDSPATAATRRLGQLAQEDSDVEAACQQAAALFPDEANSEWVLDSYTLGYNSPVTVDGDVERGLCAGLQSSEE